MINVQFDKPPTQTVVLLNHWPDFYTMNEQISIDRLVLWEMIDDEMYTFLFGPDRDDKS